MSILISVVVCTHNRAALLNTALQTLCEQSLAANEYEIIVVDNNSTDDTRSIVEKFIRTFSHVRYCHETKVGLSHARNRGWREARAEYVAYTDDDCKLPPQWLAVAKELIEQISPDVFGGPHYAFYITRKPRWFKDVYESRELDKSARKLSHVEYLIGCNIFFRKKLLESQGGFNVKLGMTGEQVAYGEEAEIQRRIRESTSESMFYYEPKLYVNHLVRPEQMTLPWLMRAFFGKGRYVYLAHYENNSPSSSRLSLQAEVAKTLLAFARDLSFGVLLRDRIHYPYYQNYLYEHISMYLRSLGRLYEKYRHTKRKKKPSRNLEMAG